VQRGDKE